MIMMAMTMNINNQLYVLRSHKCHSDPASTQEDESKQDGVWGVDCPHVGRMVSRSSSKDDNVYGIKISTGTVTLRSSNSWWLPLASTWTSSTRWTFVKEEARLNNLVYILISLSTILKILEGGEERSDVCSRPRQGGGLQAAAQRGRQV